jgi:hypothetical protein
MNAPNEVNPNQIKELGITLDKKRNN